MKWEGEEQSDNVEDRRGESGDDGGGFGGLGIGGRSIGLGSIAIALVAGWVFGINPLTVLGLLSGGGGGGTVVQQPVQPHRPVQASPEEQKEVVFTKVVLRDTEKVWSQVFQAAGGTYVAPKLDLFRGRIQTACGTGQTAQGPFYCPGDRKVYIDLSFFDTLSQRLGAPGEFARAYVIAHEVGHHVQNLMGITGKVDAARSRETEAQANAMSVRVELQADCLAGVWAHVSKQNSDALKLEASDIEAALNAASQIGDDTLQRKARGTVVPESFTHGSSAQRVSWFKRGFDSGSVKQCNTFEARP